MSPEERPVNLPGEEEDAPVRSATGPAWFLALLCLSWAAFALYMGGRNSFSHGEELFWLIAYLTPLLLAVVSLVLSLVHVARGRWRMLVAWLPAIGSMLFVIWLSVDIFG